MRLGSLNRRQIASTYLVGMNESENQKVDLSYLASIKVVRKI